MARKTPPPKPVYPKQEAPRRPKPARPVYHPPGTEAPRRPTGQRLIFDYEKETAHSTQGGTPAIHVAPLAPEHAHAAQDAAARGIEHPAARREEGAARPPRRSERQGSGVPPVGFSAGERPPARPPAARVPQNGKPQRPAQGARPMPPKRKKRKRSKRPPKMPLTPRQLRRRRIRRGILVGVLVAVLLGGGLWASAAVLFKISAVTIETPQGEVAYDASQITAAFGHAQGENLFGFNIQETQQNIAAALPYLETVEIRRRLPDTVLIVVTPAVEASVVESASGWAVLSQSYKVLRLDSAPPENLIRINGAQAEAPVPGQPVQLSEEDKLPLLQNLLEKAAAQGFVAIDEIDLSNTLELSFLYEGRIRIVLGTANDLDYKLKWAWRMVTPGETSDSLGESERGTLDVSERGEDGLGRARWRAGVL